ncbi:MAG: DUF4412 domain-containing protein [Bacteroidota bacterium]
MKAIILSMCLLVSSFAQAQFLKKLGDKVTDEAEKTVTRKSANKTSDEVGKGMDGIFSGKSKKAKGNSKAAKPAKSYDFTYHYKMKVTADHKPMEMDYYFKPKADYVGIAIQQQGMNIFSVFDYKKETAYNFLQNQKMYNAIGLDLNSENDWVNNSYSKSDYTVTDLPTKNILGYQCKGKLLENEEWKFTVYYTDEVEVGFDQMLNASNEEENNASILREYFKDAEKAMIMFMETVDKTSKKEETSTMECIHFEKIDNSFSTKDYRSY